MKTAIYGLFAIIVWHALAAAANAYTTLSGDQFLVYTLVGVVSILLADAAQRP